MTQLTVAKTVHEPLKFGRYYVAEVAWSPNNVIHKAILFDYRGDSFSLFEASYTPMVQENITVERLCYIKVVGEITSMKEPGEFITPAEALKAQPIPKMPEGCDAEIREWMLVPFDLGKAFPHFQGKIYGDKKDRFKDGTDIRTSPIVEGPSSEGIIKTENSTYWLSTPHPNNFACLDILVKKLQGK
jgi:hypothetical protein